MSSEVEQKLVWVNNKIHKTVASLKREFNCQARIEFSRANYILLILQQTDKNIDLYMLILEPKDKV